MMVQHVVHEHVGRSARRGSRSCWSAGSVSGPSSSAFGCCISLRRQHRHPGGDRAVRQQRLRALHFIEAHFVTESMPRLSTLHFIGARTGHLQRRSFPHDPQRLRGLHFIEAAARSPRSGRRTCGPQRFRRRTSLRRPLLGRQGFRLVSPAAPSGLHFIAARLSGHCWGVGQPRSAFGRCTSLRPARPRGVDRMGGDPQHLRALHIIEADRGRWSRSRSCCPRSAFGRRTSLRRP